MHRALLQVPSPARPARHVESHRRTLDLYANNGIADAQSTTVRLENALREAILENPHTDASSGAISNQRIATLRKLLQKATKELIRRCLHPPCVDLVSGTQSSHTKKKLSNPKKGSAKYSSNDVGLVSSMVLPLVEKIVCMREQAEARHSVFEKLEHDLRSALVRADEAEEKAELMRLTLEEKNASFLHQRTNKRSSKRDDQDKDTVAALVDKKPLGVRDRSASVASCQTDKVVVMMPSDHSKLALLAKNEKEKYQKLLKDHEAFVACKVNDQKENEIVKLLKDKLKRASEQHEEILKKQKRAFEAKEKEFLKKVRSAEKCYETSEKQLKSARSEIASIRKEVSALEKRLEGEKKRGSAGSEAFQTLVKERGKLLKQVKQVVGDSERLRACLIEAEADGHRLRAEISAQKKKVSTLEEKLAHNEAEQARREEVHAKQLEETFDAERRERESRMEVSDHVTKSVALQKALEAEKRMGELAVQKSAEVQERLRRNVEVEVKKSTMLQEELKAATLCLEVRKDDHAKSEAKWKAEKARLEEDLAKLREVAGARDGDKGDSKVGFLRDQLSQAHKQLENQRASHGREVSLLRKELHLEQRRTESLAREVNLLRANDTANFVTKRCSKRELIEGTMSSLRDRVQVEQANVIHIDR